MPATPDAFRGALKRFGSGVTVITTRTDAGDHGMTASAFCSLSLNPPRVLVCVAKPAAMHGHLERAGRYAVNVLSEAQRPISDRFASRLSDAERFAGLSFERAPESGAAWFEGSLCWLDCRIVAAHDGGDHTIFVGEVEAAAANEEVDAATALLYHAGRYRRVGESL